jgi:hypothetical protein
MYAKLADTGHPSFSAFAKFAAGLLAIVPFSYRRATIVEELLDCDSSHASSSRAPDDAVLAGVGFCGF